jgi:hypothetical protein
MQSVFTEMMKAGKQFWVKKLQVNPKADYTYGLEQLFRYYILTKEQSEELKAVLFAFGVVEA